MRCTKSILAVIILGGAAVRLLLVAFGAPDGPPHYGDHAVYFSVGKGLADSWSEWIQAGSEFGYRAPLYFIYVAVGASLNLESFAALQLWSALLGIASIPLGFTLGRRISGSRAGLVLAACFAFIPTFVISDTFVMSESLFKALMLVYLTLTARYLQVPSVTLAGVIGVALALLLLTREAASVLLIATVITLIVGRQGVSRESMLGVVGLLVGLAITLAPWMARNVHVWEEPFPLSHTSGVNIHMGNCDEATGRYVNLELPDDIPGFGTPARDSWHKLQALQWASRNPAAAVSLVPYKIGWLLWPQANRADIKHALPGLGSAGKPLAIVSALASLALLGVTLLALAWAPIDRFSLLCWLIFLGTLATSAIAVGGPRFCLPVDLLGLALAVQASRHLPGLLPEARLPQSYPRLRWGIFAAMCVSAGACLGAVVFRYYI